jgi:hypothetical protein
MHVSYVEPARRATERVRRMLFGTFRIETWLVLGFAAFLSEYLSGNSFFSGGSRGRFDFHEPRRPFDPQAVLDRVRGFLHDPFWMGLMVWLVLGATVLALVCLYLSSRGKFVFLDDVVRERAAIVEPWSRFRRQANSLFVFRLVLVLVMLAAVAGVIAATVGPALREVFLHEPDVWRIFWSLLHTLVLLSGVGLLFGVVSLLLGSFIVPIMYLRGVGVTEAWRLFLPLLGQHVVGFLVYAIMVVVLQVLTMALVIIAGFATCCIGFLLMGTPYVGQVVLLPVFVFFRGLGPEFLAQFGPEWDVFAARPRDVVDAPPAVPGPTA